MDHAMTACSGSAGYQGGNADLEHSNLTGKVPSDHALTRQFHTVQLGLDAASAVVAAISSPDHPA